MKIEDATQSLSVNVPKVERVEQQAAGRENIAVAAAAKPADSKDKLNISSASESINRASSTMQIVEEFRADKVNEIKKAIENNQYKVDSREVAQKMIAAFSRGPTA